MAPRTTTRTYSSDGVINQPTVEEMQLLLAIRNLKRFEKLEIKLNEKEDEVVWTLTSTHRQIYRIV